MDRGCTGLRVSVVCSSACPPVAVSSSAPHTLKSCGISRLFHVKSRDSVARPASCGCRKSSVLSRTCGSKTANNVCSQLTLQFDISHTQCTWVQLQKAVPGFWMPCQMSLDSIARHLKYHCCAARYELHEVICNEGVMLTIEQDKLRRLQTPRSTSAIGSTRLDSLNSPRSSTVSLPTTKDVRLSGA